VSPRFAQISPGFQPILKTGGYQIEDSRLHFSKKAKSLKDPDLQVKQLDFW